MASYYPSFAFLLPRDRLPATPLSPHDNANKLIADGDDFGRYIFSAGSRHGGFNLDVRHECERVGLAGLEFLYSRPWESPSGTCVFAFHQEMLPVLQENLQALMLAFSENPKGPLGYREDVLKEMALEPTFKPDLDEGQYIDYLLSLQELARQAQVEGLALLYVQMDGG